MNKEFAQVSWLRFSFDELLPKMSDINIVYKAW